MQTSVPSFNAGRYARIIQFMFSAWVCEWKISAPEDACDITKDESLYALCGRQNVTEQKESLSLPRNSRGFKIP